MKSIIFNNELEFIKNKDIEVFTRVALDNLPDYFYSVAASSTGKYHPSYALGDGGLVRHTKAAVRFANHLLQLEHNQLAFGERQRDCIISAIMLHDGWKHGNNGSQFTTHEHPQVCADWIVNDKLFEGLLNEDEKGIISSAISSHMGQWNTNKRSSLILDKPKSDIQKFVHMCDYLASRKDIEVLFENEERSPQELPNINDYRLSFGKYKDQLLVDVAEQNKGYLVWIKENTSLKEPLKSFVEQLLRV